MFLVQSVREQGVPFIPSVEIPNSRLTRAKKEVEAIESGKIKEKNIRLLKMP